MAEGRLLYARLSPQARQLVIERAKAERREASDEIGLIVERALGLASPPVSLPSGASNEKPAGRQPVRT